MPNKPEEALKKIRAEVMRHSFIPETIKESFSATKTSSGKIIIKKKSHQQKCAKT